MDEEVESVTARCPYDGAVVTVTRGTGSNASRTCTTCPRCGAVIVFDARASVRSLQVTGTDADEVDRVSKDLLGHMTATPVPASIWSPWRSGSFYAFIALLAIGVLLTAARVVSAYVLPMVIIGALLLVVIVGALQLRQDHNLDQESFLELMRLALTQVGYVRDDPMKKRKKTFRS